MFGKAIGGDIACNKKTFMLINAYNHANATQRAELDRWISSTDFDRDEKVKAVTRLYNEIGVDKLAQEKIASCFEQSKGYLDAVKVDEGRKQELRQYVERLMNRKF